MTGRQLRFTKMHGIGNDYVYVDAREEQVDNPCSLATALSDRHRGIGADGLIIVEPTESQHDCDVRMRMFNADGSEAQMCGNGIRCVAKFVSDRGIVQGSTIRIATGAGVLAVDVIREGGEVVGATVDMGPARTTLGDIPAVIPGRQSTESSIGLSVDFSEFLPRSADALNAVGTSDLVSCVSMGNPHVVLWMERPEDLDLSVVGPEIESHPWFPERINAHFVHVEDANRVVMRTWERGSGVTMACGTGASAVCAAGVLEGRTHEHIHAVLPGGVLELAYDRSSTHVSMSGPAQEVFTGTIDLGHLEVLQ